MSGRHRAPVLRSARVADRTRAAVVAVLAALLALGPAATANAAVESYARVVKVLPGNTLSGIAQTQCGTARAWPAIAAANPIIRNPNLIYPGQRLTIACTVTTRSGTAPASRSTPRGGWIHPLGSGTKATSCWGAPRVGHTHKGVDLPARSGTPVRAVHAGRVIRISYDSGGAGWYIAVDHGEGHQSVYEHLQARPSLAVGTRVAVGQTVGRVGQTGNARSPHLHFEIHYGLWHPINPAPFMRAHGAPVGC